MSDDESGPLLGRQTVPLSPATLKRSIVHAAKTIFFKPEYIGLPARDNSFVDLKSDACKAKVCDGENGRGDEERRDLSFVGLIAVCYFLVCGGAYGTEDLASTIPPFFALLGILCIPWLWSLPVALIVAELGTSMPSNDGFLGWIRRAWGTGAAFFDGALQ